MLVSCVQQSVAVIYIHVSILYQSQKEFKNQTKFQSILRMNDTIPDGTSWPARRALFQRDGGDFPSTQNAQWRTEQEATLVKFALQPLKQLRI